jgi:hypothetical protein
MSGVRGKLALFFYGPDAGRLVDIVEPILQEAGLLSGATGRTEHDGAGGRRIGALV